MLANIEDQFGAQREDFIKGINISAVFKTSITIGVSGSVPHLTCGECTEHWFKIARAATNADPPRLETPEVIKWSVATVLAMCRSF